MPDMNSTSASLYGSSPSPGGVGWRRDEGALAQPPPTAAAARHVAIASRHCLLMTAYGNRFASGLSSNEPSFASKARGLGIARSLAQPWAPIVRDPHAMTTSSTRSRCQIYESMTSQQLFEPTGRCPLSEYHRLS